MSVTGLYRVRESWGPDDGVVVRYKDNKRMVISQARYESQEYAPDVETLPWQPDKKKPKK
jgi:hypothetical protein